MDAYINVCLAGSSSSSSSSVLGRHQQVDDSAVGGCNAEGVGGDGGDSHTLTHIFHRMAVNDQPYSLANWLKQHFEKFPKSCRLK